MYVCTLPPQVLRGNMEDAINILAVLASTIAVYENMSYIEFLHVSNPTRANIRDPILQWVPRILEADRVAWEEEISAATGINRTIQAFVRGLSPLPLPPFPGCVPPCLHESRAFGAGPEDRGVRAAGCTPGLCVASDAPLGFGGSPSGPSSHPCWRIPHGLFSWGRGPRGPTEPRRRWG